MKIALISPASLPATQFGGILFLMIEIAKELSGIGHNLTIFTTDLDFANNTKTFNKKLPREENIEGFKINRTHVWFYFQLFFVNPGMYFQLIKEKPLMIHTIGARSFQSFIAAIVAKKLKIPLILSDQGGLTTHPELNIGWRKIFYKIQEPLIKFIIKRSTRIIVPNNYEKEIFLKYVNESKIKIIKNGIDLKELSAINFDFKKEYDIQEEFVLFVGRFHKVKGVDTLLKAWDLIKNKSILNNVKLVIMGADFGFEEEMMKIIKELKLEQNITIIRKPPREHVIAAYASCLFLALPSRWELSPLTPLEGFSFKKTCVSTNAHGIPHTINDKKNCLLVEPDNPKQLGEAILNLAINDKLRNSLGQSGYELVQNVCNSKTMTENFLEVYSEVTR